MNRRNFKNGNFNLDEFENHLKEEDKSSRTIETYMENIYDFIDYIMNIDQSLSRIEEISSIDIIEYRSFCMSKKNSVSTLNLKLSSLNAYFTFLVEMKIITKNPALQVKKIKVDNTGFTSQKTFDEKTFRALRRLYYREMNPLHICIFELLSKTGIRASELCALKVENFDIQIFDQNSRSGKVGFIGKGNSYREIPLHSDVRAAIREWMAFRETRQIKSEYMLISERKEKFTTGGLRAIVRKYHSQVPGCNKFSLHSYRHYFAISLLRGNPPVDIVIVQRLLSHKSLLSTQIYTQANYSDLENAIDSMK